MRKYWSSWRYWWEEWVKPILVAAVLAMFIRTFIAQPFKIPSNSMYPTLKPGDRIFVNKFIYGAKVPFTPFRLPSLEKPRTGDIVVFLSPVEENKYLVKRFIASGGQTVKIDDGYIYVDGKEIHDVPFKNFFYYNRGRFGAADRVINVPEGTFYALGDNSANSLDSRYWGFIPEQNLVGKAFLIHWPIKRVQMLNEED